MEHADAKESPTAGQRRRSLFRQTGNDGKYGHVRLRTMPFRRWPRAPCLRRFIGPPSIWWHVERITVITPIRRIWQASVTHGRQALYLEDVCYVLEATFELTKAAGLTESPAQHAHMFQRRARASRYFRPPFLGQRELAADMRLLGHDEVVTSHYEGSGALDLGWMQFDRDREDRNRLRFSRPVMVDGSIDLTSIYADTLPS